MIKKITFISSIKEKIVDFIQCKKYSSVKKKFKLENI